MEGFVEYATCVLKDIPQYGSLLTTLIKDPEVKKSLVEEAKEYCLSNPIDSHPKVLFFYDQPVLGPDGTCSLHKKAEKPFNLGEIYGLKDLENESELKQNFHTKRLYLLQQVVKLLQKDTSPDWLGIYRKIQHEGNHVLLKEAYLGEFSRPIFPLTESFQQISTNSLVGATGKARILQDTDNSEGPYYQCSNKVKSEFCAPILNKSGQILGIIDAESWQKNYFTPKKSDPNFESLLRFGKFTGI